MSARKKGKADEKLTPIASRDKSDDKGPRINKDVSEGGVPGGCTTAVVLVDIEPMTRDNVFWDAKEVGLMEMKKKKSAYAQPSATLEFRLQSTGR